jgi:hypothetical protein
MPEEGKSMANGKRYEKQNNVGDELQNESVPGMRSESSGEVRNAGGTRFEVLNVQPFLLHNAHVRRGKRQDAKCSVCGYKMENFTIQVGEDVPELGVGESGGADDAESTASSLDRSLGRIFGV